MSFKSFVRTAGAVSLKALRTLLRAIGALMAGFVWALGEGMKYSSNDSDPTGMKEMQRQSDDYNNRAAADNYKY